MSITPEVSAKSLTQLVATEIKVAMARGDVRQSQLARKLGKNEQWLSVRLRGVQPIDMNDLHRIAEALGVGVHDLLPSPDVAAGAASPRSTHGYLTVTDSAALHTSRPRDNRPPGQPRGGSPTKGGRTTYLSRSRRGMRG